MRLDGEFDPLTDKLKLSLTSAPDHLTQVDLHMLTEFQRALVVVDGTVSTFIEAYTLEPIEAIRLGGDADLTFCDRFWLEVPDQGTDVAVRRTVLQGEYSRSFYVYSVSHIVPSRLPHGARQRLEEGRDLGDLLEDVGLETRRELLWIGRERLKHVPVPLAIQGHSEFISRAYRVIAAGRPVALVNERFPATLDGASSMH